MSPASKTLAADPELPEWVLRILRCPACGARLVVSSTSLNCVGVPDVHAYPCAAGVPILIDENRSVFTHRQFIDDRETFFRASYRSSHPIGRHLELPRLSRNYGAEGRFDHLRALSLTRSSQPDVLIVGSGMNGDGIDRLLNDARPRVLHTDIHIGPRTALVCDCHALPFESSSFDVVVAQAVLEHVLDPAECVSEIHRVLRPEGLVYVEIPFMQQVHGGRHDFHRFTHLGLRRLLREFDEVTSGCCCGPGMALAWSYRYFLTSLFVTPRARAISSAFARLTAAWLPLVDRYLVDRPGALDAASGYFFLGTRSDAVRTDRQVLDSYEGLN